jgi:hypothetical protein
LTEEKATHTNYITVTDVSDHLEELLSILPNSINSLKDVGMYNEWINYIRMLGSNEFPLKNIAHLLFCGIIKTSCVTAIFYIPNMAESSHKSQKFPVK